MPRQVRPTSTMAFALPPPRASPMSSTRQYTLMRTFPRRHRTDRTGHSLRDVVIKGSERGRNGPWYRDLILPRQTQVSSEGPKGLIVHNQDWMESRDVNVFEMYVANGGAGFWLRRTTWGGTCARVVRVGAITGPDPYYGNPSVLVDVYSLSGQLKEGPVQLPVPGTYKTWRQIEPPEWAYTANLRPLDDPILDTALARLDKKRGKSES